MLTIPLHYWVTKKSGYVLSSSPTCPIKKNKKIGRISYIGFTFDEGWPKTMNTGRVFYPPKTKSVNKYGLQNHNKKLSGNQKTENRIKQQRQISSVPTANFGVVTDTKMP